MILTAASKIYGAAATWRRRWYARDPSRRRRLGRPVISIGNLSTGGSGKTPVVAHIATLLTARGERPAILSRGYRRSSPSDGVTVVSDRTRVLVSLAHAGDEPLMLAQALPGVPVLVCADRYLAGRRAEQDLGATVHLLDDGFQHLGLERDVDLLIAGSQDLLDHVLPAGRLREPVIAARAADAVLINDPESSGGQQVGQALGLSTIFHLRRAIGAPRWMETGLPADIHDEVVLAVAGIARPERFFADLQDARVRVASTMPFRDHHPYTDADVERIASAARSVNATVVVTTEKDAVRLSIRQLRNLRVAVVPLTVTIEPSSFIDWLLSRLAPSTRPPAPGPLHPAPGTQPSAPGTQPRAPGTRPPAPGTRS